MVFRTLTENDTEDFFRMLCRLDEETEYMMYEPGERKNPERLRATVASAESGGDFLLAAVTEDGEIAGFIWASRGDLNRVLHTAYIVTGIRKAWRRQGIGTEFFNRLDDWARANGLVRLELTVECPNVGAKALYEKHGFCVEGIRPKSMKVNGAYVDEYYMGKILE